MRGLPLLLPHPSGLSAPLPVVGVSPKVLQVFSSLLLG